MSTQAHPLTDLGFKPEAQGHPLSDLGFKPEEQEEEPWYNRFAGAFNRALTGSSNLEEMGGKIKDFANAPAPAGTEGTPYAGQAKLGQAVLDLLKNMWGGQQHETSAGIEQMQQPGILNKLGGAVRYAQGGIPGVGPVLGQSQEQLGRGDVAGGLGTLSAMAAPAVAGPLESAASAKAAAVKESVSPAIRKTLGVGPEFTEQAIKDYQGKAAGVTETNRLKSETYQGKVEAAKQANESAKQTYLQKQQLQDEAMDHAKELSEHLPQLKEQEKAFAKALYPEVEGTADAREMQGKLQDAIDTNIRGTDKPPAALARIVKDLEPENPLAQASVFRGAGTEGRGMRGGTNIMDLPAAARERILSRMPQEERTGYEAPAETTGKSLTFEQMHGYYSELGEELSKDLAGDERAAVTQARATLLDQMRKMAESQNKLTQFTEAQKNWSKYENTFNKTWNDKRGVASPIAKALNAKDPVSGQMLPDRLAKTLTKDDNYKLAQQMLSRYQGAKTDVLQLLKEKTDQAGGMPKTIKETAMPQPPAMKAMPPTIDIQGLKADAIKKKMDMLGGFSGRGMFIDSAALVHFLTTGNPVALSIPIGRRLLAKAIKAGAKSGSLVGVTPEEAAMLKDVDQSVAPKNIPPSQVHPTKAAALAARKP